MKIFFTLLLFSALSSVALTQEIKCNDISDILGNSYSLNKSSLKKTSANTYVNFSYDNFNLGNISSVDISNPYKIILFYKNFNKVIILDDKLSKIDSRNFNFSVNNICWNFDGNLLIYDYSVGFFFIFNLINEKIISSTPFYTALPPLFLFEQNNNIFMVGNSDIYIFDNFLNLQNKIKKSAKTCSITKGKVSLFDSLGKQININKN